MEKTLRRKFRIQLSGKELWQLRNLLAGKYHCDRRNIYWRKKRIARGETDSRVYPVALMEKHLKEKKRLLKKLSRYLNVKWFER